MKLISEAIFQSARTTVDGGWRVSFDLSEVDGDFITSLAKLKGESLFIVVQSRTEVERIGNGGEILPNINEDEHDR